MTKWLSSTNSERTCCSSVNINVELREYKVVHGQVAATTCSRIITHYRLSQKSISLIDEMYSTICVELAEDHFIGLVWCKSIHIFTKICAKKRFYVLVPSDLDLWPLELKFVPLVTLVHRCVSTELEVSIRLSYFEKIGGTARGTDGQRRTDVRGATLNAAHYGGPHNNLWLSGRAAYGSGHLAVTC